VLRGVDGVPLICHTSFCPVMSSDRRLATQSCRQFAGVLLPVVDFRTQRRASRVDLGSSVMLMWLYDGQIPSLHWVMVDWCRFLFRSHVRDCAGFVYHLNLLSLDLFRLHVRVHLGLLFFLRLHVRADLGLLFFLGSVYVLFRHCIRV
jgi:hypothetical protein